MKTDYTIRKIYAREILDSRGNPTVEVDVSTKSHTARAAVPSGASTGIHEALELRDKGPRYNGKGVRKAVNNVNLKIFKSLIGNDCRKQKFVDEIMLKLDGTKNKSKLGANAILGVSLANARLAAVTQKKELYEILNIGKIKGKGNGELLPVPCMNVINGGVHADNKLQFQEFMVCPRGRNFTDSLRAGTEIYHELKGLIHKKFGKISTNVGDEGGFAPNIKKVEEALLILNKAIEQSGYAGMCKIAMDAAASEFYSKKKGKYFVDGKWMTPERLTVLYEKIMDEAPVFSIEDPFDQDDFESWPLLTRIGKQKNVQIVGDDLLVTNPDRIQMALDHEMCNSLLLKVNQIGTLTEAVDAAKLAMKNNWTVMVSHRSGETPDSFIADLVVGLGTGQIKSGAPCRGERLSKYNQLMRIEEHLGDKARMAKPW